MTEASQGSSTSRTLLRRYGLLVPHLAKLVWRLARDPRVPARSKAMLLVTAGYIASPVDVLPDFLPALGQFDDLILIAFVLDQLINRVPAEVVTEHWDGDDDVLRVVQEILDVATGFVPGWIKKRFG